MSRWVHLLALVMLALTSGAGHAVQVQLTLPNKLVVLADYHPGAAEKPAVILLHGFLQTHEFHTIHRLAEGLASEGYTVLTPTLSLGLSHRKQSLACEALHTHTMSSDLQEIDAWVKWLKVKKNKKIVLASHSLGSMQALAYLAAYPDAGLGSFVGISLVEARLKLNEQARTRLLSALRKKIRNGSRDMVENQFSFCQRYRSTPESALSYMEWGPDKILAAIRKTTIPVTMIMGSRDDRLGPDWIERLRTTQASVIVIEGANHFMDGQHEFDLLDHLLTLLKGA